MKPKRNRFYCNDCGRIKIRFESKSKADNFIKFNGSEIEMETGIRPIRSYHCRSCNSWHVTSSEKSKMEKSKTELIMEEYKQINEKYDYNSIKYMSTSEIERKYKIQIQEKTNRDTKGQREHLKKQFENIESNIIRLKTLNQGLECDFAHQILNRSFLILREVKSIILKLETTYKKILSNSEMNDFFKDIWNMEQDLENKLDSFKQKFS